MKKIYPFIVIPVFIILITIIVIDRRKDINTKVITINTNYTNLYDNDSKIELSFYINNNKHPLINKESYEDIYIKDLFDTKTLSLNLLDITYSHSEVYLKETYYSYNLLFDSINLTNNFNIDESYLSLNLINGDNYLFKMGKFSLMYLDDATELPWSNLDSVKNNDTDISISNVEIDLYEQIDSIENIYINEFDSLTYNYFNNKISIELNNINKYYTNNLPIIIKTTNQTYYINNHKYFIDLNLIEKSKDILNIYEVN